jgi:hypothetical protein
MEPVPKSIITSVETIKKGNSDRIHPIFGKSTVRTPRNH